MKPEEIVEDYLINEAKKHKILCYKFVSPGNRGVPDRILIGNDKVVFVELKAKDKVPRALQNYCIKQMRNAGADVRVADTRELVDEIIQNILS